MGITTIHTVYLTFSLFISLTRVGSLECCLDTLSCCIVFKHHLPMDWANVFRLYCFTPPINRHEKHVQVGY